MQSSPPVAEPTRRVGVSTSERGVSYPIPALVKRNTVLLAVAQACVGVGNQMVPTLGALMAVSLVGTTAVAGTATGIMGGCRLITAYPMGYVADRFGRRGALLLGLLLAMLGAFVV